MIIGYMRSPKIDNNDDVQPNSLAPYNCDLIYSEHASVRDTYRTEWNNLCAKAGAGDAVVISSFLQVAADIKELFTIIRQFHEAGVRFVSLKENFDSFSDSGKTGISFLYTLEEFEKDCARERMMEGVAVAKANGRYTGRKPIELASNKLEYVYNRWSSGLITAVQAEAELGVKPNTFYRRMQQYEHEGAVMISDFRLGELFCGPGGLACGAMRAKSSDGKLGLTHAWANDYDPDTCETYRNNICPDDRDSVYCGDVRELNIEKLGEIDAFAYGFPCNSFSSVGEHKGFANEKYGQLYYYGVQVLNTYKPKWFIAENVSGIRSAGSGDFQTILDDLRSAGYKLTVNLYKAEQYGVPQTRHRVIIVGIRDDLPYEFHVPDPAIYADCNITAEKALEGIPKNAPNAEYRKLTKDVVRRLSLIKPGENIWGAEERLGTDFPEELRINTKTKISQIYRKLDPNKPAYTVTAAGGGGTFMYHWTDRELSNRERARLQTFPDDFAFVGKYSSVRKQIGMAVPCRLAEIVVTAVLNTFAGIEYPWVEPNLSDNSEE